MPAIGGFLDAGAVGGQQPDNVVHIDPDFRVAFLLALVKDQLQPEMQMNGFNIIDIFPVRIARSSHESDQIPGLNQVAHFQSRGEGPILLQLGIIILTPGVKRAYANPPAAVAVPAHGLYHAALHSHNRRSQSAHQIVAQMLAGEAEAAADTKIVTVGIPVSYVYIL